LAVAMADAEQRKPSFSDGSAGPDPGPKYARNGGVTVSENRRDTALIRDDDELLCPLTLVGRQPIFGNTARQGGLGGGPSCTKDVDRP
jgi:hypothetical protein